MCSAELPLENQAVPFHCCKGGMDSTLRTNTLIPMTLFKIAAILTFSLVYF